LAVVTGLREAAYFDQRKDTAAVDVNVTEKHRLRFRATNYTYLEYQPLDGNTDRTPKFFDRPNKTGSLDYVWTISRVRSTSADHRKPGHRKDTVDAANLFRPHQGMRAIDGALPISIIRTYSAREADSDAHTNREYVQLLGAEWRPYPSHSSGPIYGRLTALPGSEEPHAEVRRAV